MREQQIKKHIRPLSGWDTEKEMMLFETLTISLMKITYTFQRKIYVGKKGSLTFVVGRTSMQIIWGNITLNFLHTYKKNDPTFQVNTKQEQKRHLLNDKITASSVNNNSAIS